MVTERFLNLSEEIDHDLYSNSYNHSRNLAHIQHLPHIRVNREVKSARQQNIMRLISPANLKYIENSAISYKAGFTKYSRFMDLSWRNNPYRARERFVWGKYNGNTPNLAK